MNHILVVDDEAEIRASLEEILSEEGYGVASAATATEAMVLLRDTPYDVVLLDIWLPDRDGLDVLADIHQLAMEMRPEVVIISGHGTIEAAVKATKLGAYDFLEKPLSLDRTLIVVKNAVEARRLRTENIEFKRHFEMDIVLTGDSVPAKALRQQIKLMAPTNGRVLIYGESGTGKELIARSIHTESLRRDQIFVELNCAAIPEAHIEAELFGYRHNAQPGGPAEQRGTLERADGGTLFLDEVGELTLPLQAKLLRFIQEREFERLGGAVTKKVDVRVIAATNKDLALAVSDGAFREDLFYRLNVFPIQVPPLRERKEDIPALLSHFLEKTSQEYGRNIEITRRAMALMERYEWPGNVREMENLIERMVIMADDDTIDADILPGHLSGLTADQNGEPPISRIEEMERKEILAALERNGWNQTRTARELGLTLRQISYRVRKFGFDKVVEEHKRSKQGYIPCRQVRV